jgi:Glyoxalase-like domain
MDMEPPAVRSERDRVAVTWFALAIDCDDPELLAEFWCEVLGYVVVFRGEGEIAIAVDDQTHPGLMFVRVDDPKRGKNRLHLDLTPEDQRAEVERLIALGAQQVDVGQGDASWVVMADPEGNEFCVLAH